MSRTGVRLGVTGYVKSLGKAKAHLRYIAFRPRAAPDEVRGVFSRDSDHANLDAFYKRIEEDRLLRHPAVAKLHKFYVSLSNEQFADTKMARWHDAVREVMSRYEQETGRRLDWIAAEHTHRSHRHVHIAIRSTYVDEAGKEHRLRLDREDIKYLRQEFNRAAFRQVELERGLQRPGEALTRLDERQQARAAHLAARDASGTLGAIGKLLKSQLDRLEAERRAQVARAERERVMDEARKEKEEREAARHRRRTR